VPLVRALMPRAASLHRTLFSSRPCSSSWRACSLALLPAVRTGSLHADTARFTMLRRAHLCSTLLAPPAISSSLAATPPRFFPWPAHCSTQAEVVYEAASLRFFRVACIDSICNPVSSICAAPTLAPTRFGLQLSTRVDPPSRLALWWSSSPSSPPVFNYGCRPPWIVHKLRRSMPRLQHQRPCFFG
jgi:hypothetical protein